MIFVDSQAQKAFAFAMFSGNFLILHQQTGGAQFVLEPNGNLTVSGSYFSSSIREVKDEIVAVDPREILDRVMELPVSSWKFKAVDDGVRHIGPMAEDFQAAFELGGRDDVISTLDTSGVALGAIQGLRLELEERDQEIIRLRQQLADNVAILEARIEELRALIVGGPAPGSSAPPPGFFGSRSEPSGRVDGDAESVGQPASHIDRGVMSPRS